MILKPRITTKVPIEADCISPDTISGMSIEEIKSMEVFYGNKRKKLTDFFEVEEGADGEIFIDGDVSTVKYIGAGMKSGKIIIKGDAGMHLGSEMEGGEIIVGGNVSDWSGAETKGGLIKIGGDAGNLLGAAYRGSKVGMKGGMIIVDGNAGNEVGLLMRRGAIWISGNLGEFAGAHMSGGTIFCLGEIGERAGAEMDRGTIVAFNRIKLLPTFKHASTYNPVFLRFYLRELRKKYGLPIKDEHVNGFYDRYSGDIVELGKGEIFIWKGE